MKRKNNEILIDRSDRFNDIVLITVKYTVRVLHNSIVNNGIQQRRKLDHATT